MDPGQVHTVSVQNYSSPPLQPPQGQGGPRMTDVAFVVAAAAVVFNELFLVLS